MSNSRRTRGSGEAPAIRRYSRRDFIRGSGSAVTLGMLAGACGAWLPRGAAAQASAHATDAVTILYPAQGATFDLDYYRDHHLKLLRSIYGRAVERVELRRVVALPSASGTAAAPPFSAAVNIWINDVGAFTASAQKNAQAIADDLSKVTKATPIIQFDKVDGEMGAARQVPQVGDRCLMMLYQNGEGVRWDVDRFRAEHMPLIMKLYGPKAIKRFELRKGDHGMTQQSKPIFIGLVSIYVASQEEMQAAGKEYASRLMAEEPNFSSVDPIAFPSFIYGIA
jgi:uncharacterized protein (TIGR02118 family)